MITWSLEYAAIILSVGIKKQPFHQQPTTNHVFSILRLSPFYIV